MLGLFRFFISINFLIAPKNNFFRTICYELLFSNRSGFDPLPHLVLVSLQAEKSALSIGTVLSAGDDAGVKRETTILAFLLKSVRQQLTVVETSVVDKTELFDRIFELLSTVSMMVSVYGFRFR